MKTKWSENGMISNEWMYIKAYFDFSFSFARLKGDLVKLKHIMDSGHRWQNRNEFDWVFADMTKWVFLMRTKLEISTKWQVQPRTKPTKRDLSELVCFYFFNFSLLLFFHFHNSWNKVETSQQYRGQNRKEEKNHCIDVELFNFKTFLSWNCFTK